MSKRPHDEISLDSSTNSDRSGLLTSLSVVTSSAAMPKLKAKRKREISPVQSNDPPVYVVTRSEMMTYFSLLGNVSFIIFYLVTIYYHNCVCI